jgi:hypothetical protein
MEPREQCAGRAQWHARIPVQSPARQERHRFPDRIIDHNEAGASQYSQRPWRRETTRCQLIEEPMEPLDVVEAPGKWKPAQDDSPLLCLEEPWLPARIEWFNPHFQFPEQLQNRQGRSRWRSSHVVLCS